MPTRRAFLGGILTLAVSPALALPEPGLTPLENALEELRHAHLARRLDPQLGVMPTLKAVQGLRDLELAPGGVALYCRLAFRMARQDYTLVRDLKATSATSNDVPDQTVADAFRRHWNIEGDLDQSMRALPWPSGWAEQA
jgi:hypothetical protein